MKKVFTFALMTAGIAVATSSFAQDQKAPAEKKATTKMAKETKATKQADKAAQPQATATVNKDMPKEAKQVKKAPATK